MKYECNYIISGVPFTFIHRVYSNIEYTLHINFL